MEERKNESARLRFIQKNIADQADELLKMSRYTGNLLEVAGVKDENTDKNDVDCVLIQVVFYTAVYDSFISTVSRLAEDVRRVLDRAGDGIPGPQRESAELSILQAGQLEAEAQNTLAQLKKTEEVLKHYTGAKKQEKYAGEVAGLRRFRERLAEAGKE